MFLSSMEDFKNEFIAFFSKLWITIFYIFIGIIAKFSFDLITGKRITFWQAIGSVGISLFIGFLSSVYCANYHPNLTPYVVPIATLSSEKIFLAIMAIDWSKMIDVILKRNK